jgi:hypothetical protein
MTRSRGLSSPKLAVQVKAAHRGCCAQRSGSSAGRRYFARQAATQTVCRIAPSLGGRTNPMCHRPRKPGRVFHCRNSRSRALLKINPAATQLRDDQKGYAPMKGIEECWMARQSRIRRPTGPLLRPLPLRTTTISPLAGEMPVRAPMFAPCVTTRRIPLPVHLSMTVRAPAVRDSL